ncbi:MAG: response regulator transcription factor [Clostridia bacterium]|nr:response regulator transcription factor [Clostridia bacterium]
MFNILVVEDDKALNKSVCSFLNQNGYNTVGCFNADEAFVAMYETVFDIIISDIMMPGTDGFQFAKNVRTINETVPILFVTAKDDFASKERGYKAGIDDYMVKPIDLQELLLKIGAILRRAGINNSKILTVGDFTMNLNEYTAYLGGKEIVLTTREFSLLYKLLSYPKKAFTRSQLMDEFWEADTESGTRTVDVYMTKLRAKLADCDSFEIVTVRGLGYKAVIKE